VLNNADDFLVGTFGKDDSVHQPLESARAFSTISAIWQQQFLTWVVGDHLMADSFDRAWRKGDRPMSVNIMEAVQISPLEGDQNSAQVLTLG
jgi:hypothetical protein